MPKHSTSVRSGSQTFAVITDTVLVLVFMFFCGEMKEQNKSQTPLFPTAPKRKIERIEVFIPGEKTIFLRSVFFGIEPMANPGGGISTTTPIFLVSWADPFGSFANISPGTFDSTAFDFTSAGVGTTVEASPESLK